MCANHVCSSLSLQGILDEHSSVFDSKLGTLNDTTVTIRLDPTAQPRFCKARTVPYALKGKIEKELDRLVQQGVIEPICFSEWAAPIVPVLKKDGTVRICGDYKLTVNQAAKTDSYPLPKINDLFASLAGGETFSKLDLANAYLQIPLDEASQKLVTINTHKGLYKYNRLPLGISAAPSIFQRTMESILQGLPGVCVYLDNILITGKNDEEHLTNVSNISTNTFLDGLSPLNLITSHYNTCWGKRRASLLWLLPEYSVGHLCLVHIIIRYSMYQGRKI